MQNVQRIKTFIIMEILHIVPVSVVILKQPTLNIYRVEEELIYQRMQHELQM